MLSKRDQEIHNLKRAIEFYNLSIDNFHLGDSHYTSFEILEMQDEMDEFTDRLIELEQQGAQR